MPAGPLIYKILLFSTLVVGMLTLISGLVPRRDRRQRAASPPAVRPDAQAVPQVHKTEAQWRQELTPEQYEVTRRGVTERPFTGRYWDCDEVGAYHCVCCGNELFDSDAKIVSGNGWPGFTRPARDTALVEVNNISYGLVRVEVTCRCCEAHLGHVFADGPPPSGRRYCINSAALAFHPAHVAVEAAAGQ